MTTTFKRSERVETVSAWRTRRFQIFAGITVATSLLLSGVAIYCLKADVDVVTKQQIPYIQGRLANLHMHR